MCFGVLTNWVKSIKIKLKHGYLQTETSLASTACNQVEKNPIFLSSHAGCWSQTCLSLKVSTFQFYFHRFNPICQNTETHKHLFLCFCVFKDRLVQLKIWHVSNLGNQIKKSVIYEVKNSIPISFGKNILIQVSCITLVMLTNSKF